MRKSTSWDRYYDREMQNANTRRLVEEELHTLRIGVQLARLRQKAGMTQAQLAAKVGMSPPNISRIESSPGQNLTLQTLIKLFGALDHEVNIAPHRRRPAVGRRSARKA